MRGYISVRFYGGNSICSPFSLLKSVTYVAKHIILSQLFLLFSVIWILLYVTLNFVWMIVYKSHLIDFKGNL
jgi:hypothetical protein